MLSLLIDFDGTVVPCDVEFEIFARFGGPDKAGDVVARWERGELFVPDRLRQGFAAITATRAELEAYLDTVPVDGTFPPFVRFLQQHSIPFAILSDGVDWYIDGILRRHGLPGLPLICNRLSFDGDRPAIAFPHWSGDCNPCRQCGTCKRYAVREWKAQYGQVTLVSDGWADRWAAVECDLVFARDRLLDFFESQPARARGRYAHPPVIPFANFDDVKAGLLQGNSPWLSLVRT